MTKQGQATRCGVNHRSPSLDPCCYDELSLNTYSKNRPTREAQERGMVKRNLTWFELIRCKCLHLGVHTACERDWEAGGERGLIVRTVSQP